MNEWMNELWMNRASLLKEVCLTLPIGLLVCHTDAAVIINKEYLNPNLYLIGKKEKTENHKNNQTLPG